MWLDMLMVDVNATIMQATIYPDRLPVFRPQPIAGSMYTISGFDVAKCAENFRLTESPLRIRFSESTSLVQITEPNSPLPVEGFRFRNQFELFALANTETHLPDIVGELTAVKSIVSEPPEAKNHLMATIKLDNDVSLTLSLFDSRAVSFHRQLKGMRVNPRVIVATSLNPKLVGGCLLLNTTSGTHIYLDKETVAGEAAQYFKRTLRT